MGKFEGKIATNWPSEREKIKKRPKNRHRMVMPPRLQLQQNNKNLDCFSKMEFMCLSILSFHLNIILHVLLMLVLQD